MKILKETLLLNDLSGVLEVVQEEDVLIMRNEEEPVVVMTLSSYNKLKEEAYKNKK